MPSLKLMLPFVPLRVRAWLRSPVICDRWMPLDGILFSQCHREVLGEKVVSLPGEYSAHSGVGVLPFLGRAGNGGRTWFYRCSWAQWGPSVEGRDHWNKRFDNPLAYLVDFGGKRGKIDTGSGTYKAFHMPVFYRSALWVEWFCYGNRDEIEALLSTTTHIGKKGTQGWGRVGRWEIDTTDMDFSISRRGHLMRGVPPGSLPPDVTTYSMGLYGIRPSYWIAHNQMDLILPV